MGWLHRWWNPHCEHCKEERKENAQCSSCDTLREQLGIVQRERDKLLENLISPPEKLEPAPIAMPEAISKSPTPWPLKQRLLEQESRREAQVLRAKQQELKDAEASQDTTVKTQTVEELEKELGVANGQSG